MKWEYKQGTAATAQISNIANRLGMEGWELVAVVPEYTSPSGSTVQSTLIFKRPK